MEAQYNIQQFIHFQISLFINLFGFQYHKIFFLSV